MVPVPTARLHMSQEPEMNAEEPEMNAEEPEMNAEESAPAENEEEAEAAAVPEDPEVVALKEEIAKLEGELKAKQATLSYAQDQVEEYSKGGYARKVAEMENMRRVRSSMNSSSRSSATAAALSDFLPVYDKFKELKEKYEGNEFGAKFGSLSMEASFAKMGVTEYTVEPGQKVDNYRVAAVEMEHSTDFEKDTVLRPVDSGLELEGNVIRAALCVASAGPEEDAAAAAASEESVADEQE
eukprot:scaffold24812_cov171-Cylindrotheca_fusiformis.AAC.3